MSPRRIEAETAWEIWAKNPDNPHENYLLSEFGSEHKARELIEQLDGRNSKFWPLVLVKCRITREVIS